MVLTVVLPVVLTVRVRENILIIRLNTITAIPLISLPAKMSLMKLVVMEVEVGPVTILPPPPPPPPPQHYLLSAESMSAKPRP